VVRSLKKKGTTCHIFSVKNEDPEVTRKRILKGELVCKWSDALRQLKKEKDLKNHRLPRSALETKQPVLQKGELTIPQRAGRETKFLKYLTEKRGGRRRNSCGFLKTMRGAGRVQNYTKGNECPRG